MDKMKAVFDYVNAKGWLVLEEAEEQIHPLSRSRYNDIYRLDAHEIYGESSFLFKLIHGSPLGLFDQAEYEFAVLQALRRSGVTPRPFYCDCETTGDLGDGALFTEYMAGRALKYSRDWEVAARVLGTVHSQPVNNRLIVRENPLDLMIRECSGLEHYFSKTQHGQLKAVFFGCLDDLRELADEARPLLAGEQAVIVHGQPLASDFIVASGGKSGWLVGWGGATISSRYVDIGMFMAHAALTCETGFCRNDVERGKFIQVYLDAARFDAPMDAVLDRADIFEHAAELRTMIMNCVALARRDEGM